MKKMLAALMFLPVLAMAQKDEAKVPFNGVVIGEDGNPAKNVRVYVKSENLYAVSDRNGRFGLTNVGPNDTLKVKYKKNLYIVPVNGMRSIHIQLVDQSEYTAEQDDYILSIGSDYVRARECNNASAVITGEELVRTGRTNLAEALQGKVAGLSLTAYDDFHGGAVNIRNSNFSSPNDSGAALVLVDGVEGSLSDVNVYTVDYVEILKDANMFGNKGANGAIVVYTKAGHNKN